MSRRDLRERYPFHATVRPRLPQCVPPRVQSRAFTYVGIAAVLVFLGRFLHFI